MRFPDDHPIETIRGSHIPGTSRVLRAFAQRAAWLVKKIEYYPMRASDPRASYLMDELMAIAVAVEALQPKTRVCEINPF